MLDLSLSYPKLRLALESEFNISLMTSKMPDIKKAIIEGIHSDIKVLTSGLSFEDSIALLNTFFVFSSSNDLSLSKPTYCSNLYMAQYKDSIRHRISRYESSFDYFDSNFTNIASFGIWSCLNSHYFEIDSHYSTSGLLDFYKDLFTQPELSDAKLLRYPKYFNKITRESLDNLDISLIHDKFNLQVSDVISSYDRKISLKDRDFSIYGYSPKKIGRMDYRVDFCNKEVFKCEYFYQVSEYIQKMVNESTPIEFSAIEKEVNEIYNLKQEKINSILLEPKLQTHLNVIFDTFINNLDS